MSNSTNPSAAPAASTPTSALPQPVKADSKATLRRIGFSIFVALAVGAAQSFAAILPEAANALLAVIPYGTLAAPYVAKGALFLQSYILIKATTYHKSTVSEALNAEPPPGQAKYY